MLRIIEDFSAWYMSHKKKHLVIFAFALLLMAASVFLVPEKTSSRNKSDKEVSFGYPFPFITQDFSEYDPVAYYQKIQIKKEKLSLAAFSFTNFFVSFVVTAAAVELLIYLLETADFKIRRLLTAFLKKV